MQSSTFITSVPHFAWFWKPDIQISNVEKKCICQWPVESGRKPLEGDGARSFFLEALRDRFSNESIVPEDNAGDHDETVKYSFKKQL